jgi:short-subunit dehydrogenase
MGVTERITLKGKTVLITGASRGLGREIASLFYSKGTDLILTGRNLSDLYKVKTTLLDPRNGTIDCYSLDLGDEEAIKSFSSLLDEHLYEVDILINNAAVQGPVGPFLENEWNLWTECFRVDLMAPVYLARLVLPGMIRRKYGRIISISGGGATAGRPFFSAYASAKSALVRFSETLADEVKESGITVNCVAPGAMGSRMTEEIVKAGPDIAGINEYLHAFELVSQGSTATMKRAAELVLFLASFQGDNITGKLISAIWDPWEELHTKQEKIIHSDIFTLRRITPEDRGVDLS